MIRSACLKNKDFGGHYFVRKKGKWVCQWCDEPDPNRK